MKENETEIKETIKTEDGKLKYCLQITQGEAKMQVYIRDGEIYFESCRYGFDSYPVFDFSNEAHELAKKVFVNSLKTDVQNKLMELKQLEVILDQIGLKNVISEDITKGGFLLTIKKKLLGG